MLPGFGPKESKAFLPIFQDCAESISMKWCEIVGNNNGQSIVMNVVSWLSRGALDSIGQGMVVLPRYRINCPSSQQPHLMSN